MDTSIKQIEPFLVDAKEAGRLIGVSRTHFLEMEKSGRVGPESINLSCSVQRRFKRWKLSDLRIWADCGCPSRREWEERRKIS